MELTIALFSVSFNLAFIMLNLFYFLLFDWSLVWASEADQSFDEELSSVGASSRSLIPKRNLTADAWSDDES